MSKTSWIVAGTAFLILLVGAVWFFFVNKPMTTSMQEPTAESSMEKTEETMPSSEMTPESTSGAMMVEGVEVDYTDEGFSPATVTVKKGETVKFINKSGRGMDVASNPHPIHTDYSGFDQGKSSQVEQDEYDFTFDKVGTWGYHNHLNPSNGGTVVVTE